MTRIVNRSRFSVAVACVLGMLANAQRAWADEMWVAPVLQADLGGIGVASNVVWPVTPIGAVRFAWGVPGDLQTFQSAKVVLIPHVPGGPATLNVIICAAQNGNPVTSNCAGPVAQAFTGVANQLREVDISAIVAPRVGTAGLTNIGILAYTTPTTTSDHIVGLRFAYTPVAPTITGTTTINSGNLDLDSSTVAAGNITKNGARFLHNFGTNNTFLGTTAGNFVMTGGDNTAVGASALNRNSTGNYNTAVGARTLSVNTIGSSNTALGADALTDNVSGGANTAVGTAALTNNTTGGNNTAVGGSALGSNTTASGNTAVGANALVFNAEDDNTATGANALFANSSGWANSATGGEALYANTTGNANTAAGFSALRSNTTGDENTAVGTHAMRLMATGTGNVAVGRSALSDNSIGSYNVAIGAHSGGSSWTGDYNIHIGTGVAAEENDESSTTRIGDRFVQTAAFIAGIRGRTTGMANAVPVLIDSLGQLGTASSSARFKEEIRDMAGASRRLFDLRPVTFRYKEAYKDGSKPTQFGLVAEEVADAFPELAVRDADGRVETVHYEKLSVLLLNEVQRQEQRIDALERQIADLLSRP